mgnify:CR=1 FL=1
MNTDRSVKVKDIVEKFQMEVLYPGADFDTETLEIESRIEFDCAAIGGEGTYLLPLEMHSDDYSVVQREPVYVLIQMSELKIWVTNVADLAKTSG